MKIFKLNPKAQIPAYATEGSAAFDLRAVLSLGDRVQAYNPLNKLVDLPAKVIGGKVGIQIHPQYRVMIPTGLIFDIPKNNVIEIFARSGLALKQGLNLVNGTAVIDSDYVEETFVLLFNNSDAVVVINDGDRVAQAAVKAAKQLKLEESDERPGQKTSRDGGLGSTGVS